MATGVTAINFGAFPGVTDASIAVADAGIAAGSLVESWIRPIATAEHNADEHLVEPPRVVAAAIVAGVGFTIYGYATNGRLYGNYTVAWAYV